jgi:hypothetical protein
MIQVRPMDESYIYISCLHFGPVDPDSALRPDWEEPVVPDLPPHPWSDETIAELANEYRCLGEGQGGDPTREFMREMIQRHGTCAFLAWEEGLVVGHLRFYPLSIAQLLARAGGEKQPAPRYSATLYEADPKALWVLCVMTARPNVGAMAATVDGRSFPGAKQAGARKGIGSMLVRGLVDWAGERSWKRIVKLAHPDLDVFYGICGGGGKAFWEKASFRAIGSQLKKPWKGEIAEVVERQRQERGMSEKEAWTWHLMACDLGEQRRAKEGTR